MTIVIATSQPWNEFLVEEVASRTGAKVILFTKKEELTVEKLNLIHPDYVFFPHWSFLIKSEIHQKFNCVIFHMTDLPFGRGGTPLQNSILRGLTETKISALACTEVIDGGDIYLKSPLTLSGNAREIFSRAARVILEMVVEIIQTQPKPVPQVGKVTEFTRRTPAESDLFNLSELNQVYDYIRMLDADSYPHAFITTPSFKFEFTDAQLDGDEIIAKVKIKRKS